MTILVLGSQLYSNTLHFNTVWHIIKVTLRTALDKMKTTLQFAPSALTEKQFGTDIYLYLYIYSVVCVCVCVCVCIYISHPQFQHVDIPKSDGSSHSTFHKHTTPKHSFEAAAMSCDSVSHSLCRSNCQQSYKDKQSESNTTCEYIILFTRYSSLYTSKHQLYIASSTARLLRPHTWSNHLPIFHINII